MSLVVTLLPGMPGYENHKMDYAVSNYNGEFGYRRIRNSDVEFARYLYEQTGLHIDLGSRCEARKGWSGAVSSFYYIVDENGEHTMQTLNLEASPSRYMKYALSVESDILEPNNLTLLIIPRRKPKIVKEQP